MSKIIFNGKSYSSVEEMPSEIRRAYEQVIGILADKNQNGVPDVFEKARDSNVQTIVSSNTTQIVVDGQVYSSVDELPPEARQKYEQAMDKLKQAGALGVPASPTPAQPISSISQAAPRSVTTVNSLMAEPIPSPISEAPSNTGRLLLVAGIALLILLIALGVFVLLALR